MTNEKHGLAKQDDEIKALDKIIEEYNLAKLMAGKPGSLSLTIQMAEGIEALEKALSPAIMEKIMRLKNTTLGFKTDERKADPVRKKKAIEYGVAIVKRCTIEALLGGLRMVGNEVNIISYNTYAAKAGLKRLLREYPGLTDLKIKTSVPRLVGEKGALVTFEASWLLEGKQDSIEGEIPIRVNYGMGSDAILGKADRKISYRILQHLTGSQMTLVDGDVDSLNDMQEADAEVKTLKAGRVEFGKKKGQAEGQKNGESAVTPTPETVSADKPTDAPTVTDWTEGERERIELNELLTAEKCTDKKERINIILESYAPGPVQSSTDMDVETLNIVIKELKHGASRVKMHKKLMASYKGVGRDVRITHINGILKEHNHGTIESTKELKNASLRLVLDALEKEPVGEPVKEESPKSDLFK